MSAVLTLPDNRSDRRTTDILAQLEQGVKDVFACGRFDEYLTLMARFHKYSHGNVLLVLMQRPSATRIAGMTTWNSLGRSVRKGEQAIWILAPSAFRRQVLVDVLDARGKPVTDPHTGQRRQVVRGIDAYSYRSVPVFDISQTEGEDLPALAQDLKDNVTGYDSMLAALRKVSPCPIAIEAMTGSAKGYFVPAERRIVVRAGMAPLQTLKTVLHEIAHARLHGDDKVKVSRETREVQAESVAFVVSKHFGLDTSGYSFGYLAGWSSDAQLKELRQSLPVIRREASAIIDELDAELGLAAPEPAQPERKGGTKHGTRLACSR